MDLQEYSFEIVYRSRSKKENLVADALTRLPKQETTGEIYAIKQFNTALIMENIQSQQQQDEFCSNIINYLKFNILPTDAKQSAETITWSRFMGVADDLLNHFWTCISDKRKSKCIKQLVVPTSMQPQALTFTHNDELNCSHQGLSKSFEKLRHYLTKCQLNQSSGEAYLPPVF